MNIYLVRHGQDEDNAVDILNGRRDLPLTELGREQAAETSQRLAKELTSIDAIYSSPLQRARQTAKILASEIETANFIIEDGLIERDYGILTGKSRGDIPKYSSENITVDGLLYFLSAKDAETFPETYVRAEKLLDKISQSGFKTVVLVGHRDICIMIQSAYYRWGWKNGLQKAHMDNADVLKLIPQDTN